MDDRGSILEQWTLPHHEAGLRSTLGRLRRHGSPADLPVAIETTAGLVVDRLLAAGHTVVPIHPNAFHAARPRWGAARAKTDPGDAVKLADYLRTDGARLGRLAPLDPATRRLQAPSRVRDDHLAARVAATNQLAALLAAHWPGAAAIFGRLDPPIALRFLQRYPTPQAASRLGEPGLRRFLTQAGYSGRRTPAELLARLRAAPTAPVGLDPDTLAELVGAQVRLLGVLLATIGELDRAMTAVLTEHAKAMLLAGLPRIGTVNLGQVVAEVGPLLARCHDVEHLAAEAGAAPVTRSSGKHHAVHFRWATNTRARKALMTFADNSRHASPWAATLDTGARARGNDHPHAIRILARAWLRVIWACWHNHQAYDPARHGGERRTTAQGLT